MLDVEENTEQRGEGLKARWALQQYKFMVAYCDSCSVQHQKRKVSKFAASEHTSNALYRTGGGQRLQAVRDAYIIFPYAKSTNSSVRPE